MMIARSQNGDNLVACDLDLGHCWGSSMPGTVNLCTSAYTSGYVAWYPCACRNSCELSIAGNDSYGDFSSGNCFFICKSASCTGCLYLVQVHVAPCQSELSI